MNLTKDNKLMEASWRKNRSVTRSYVKIKNPLSHYLEKSSQNTSINERIMSYKYNAGVAKGFPLASLFKTRTTTKNWIGSFGAPTVKLT